MASIRDSVEMAAPRPDATTRSGGPGNGAGRSRWARIIFVIFAWLLVAGVVGQIFIAGLAIFADGRRWETHASFVHVFEFVPLLMLVTALVGRLPRRLAVLSGTVFLLIMAQYALAQMRTSDTPELAALHVVNAAFIYYGAVTVARGGTQELRRRLAS